MAAVGIEYKNDCPDHYLVSKGLRVDHICGTYVCVLREWTDLDVAVAHCSRPNNVQQAIGEAWLPEINTDATHRPVWWADHRSVDAIENAGDGGS
jgi:hypothetical protein